MFTPAFTLISIQMANLGADLAFCSLSYPNTKGLLSDVLSMLTGFLPHGDVIQYYLCLRSCYSQFLGIWRIADEGHQPHSAPRHDDNRKQHLAKMSKGGGA